MSSTRHRTRTEEVDRVMADVLAGEDYTKVVARLSEEDRALFYELLAEIRETGTLTMEDVWKADYRRRPPTMEEFIDDDYWMAARCRTQEDNVGLFPTWRQVLTSDFNRESKLHNVVLSGAMGVGKSFVCALIFCYRIVQLLLLREPSAYFKLARDTRLNFVLMSVTKTAVQETVMGEALSFMASSPFFREETRFRTGVKYTSVAVDLGNGFFLSAGSRGQHIIGRNTPAICLDEGSWRLEKDPDLTAYTLYNDARIRIKTRFQKLGGHLPAISILASSARDESSVTEQVIREIEDAKSPATEKVYRNAIYRIKPPEGKVRWFRVAYGIRNMDPRVLGGWFNDLEVPLEGEKTEEAPNGARIELVPEDYIQEFRRRPITALQSYSGIATGASYRLFPSMVDVEVAIEAANKSGVRDPCPAASIAVSDEDDLNLFEHLDHPRFLIRRAGRVEPLRDPHVLRYAHVDLATSSQAGLAICHVAGASRVGGLFDKARGFYDEFRPVVDYDLILSIVAGAARPISIKKIQDFLFWLRAECGIRFGKVTCDSFQSGMMLQILKKEGFDVDELSVDRTKGPYYAWRDAFQERRVIMYRQSILVDEMSKLVDGPKKIDHPDKNTSKDISDAAAGAYYNAFMAEQSNLAITGGGTVYLAEEREKPDDQGFVPKPEPRPVRWFGA